MNLNLNKHTTGRSNQTLQRHDAENKNLSENRRLSSCKTHFDLTPDILYPRGRPWPISVALLRLVFSAFSEFDSCCVGTVPAPTTHAIVWANRVGFSARFPRWKHQSDTVLPEEVLHTRNPTPASIINTLSSSKVSSRIAGRGADEHEQIPSDQRCAGGIEVVLRRQGLLLGKNKIRRIQLLTYRGSFLVMMPYRLVQNRLVRHTDTGTRARARAQIIMQHHREEKKV